MPAISVVIPLYNAEGYLQRFVESLQRQTATDFEALFVDDASADASAAMLEGLATQDPRLKLLRHSRNQGAGAARNTGIRNATGETLCFADPDDLLPETSLEVRLKAYETHHAVVRACHDEFTDAGKLLNHEMRPASLPAICKPAEVAASCGVNPFLCAHWTWLFPTKMLQRLEIFNEEHTRTAEDIIFLVRSFFHIPKLVWIPDTVYRWIKRTDSLSNTAYSKEHYFDYLKCVDIFYSEAIPHRKIFLADSFCNEYLACYLPHLLFQILQGKSTEADAQAVVREAARIMTRHGVLKRCMQQVNAMPLQYSGLYRLWKALTDNAPSMIQRLLNGHQEIAQYFQLATGPTADPAPKTDS